MKSLSIFLVVSAILLMTGCDSAAPDDHHAGEQEFITRVTLSLVGGGTTVVASASDPDGDGTGFEIDPVTLRAGVTYTGTIQLYDDVNDEDVASEVAEEADEHRFFFTPGGGVAGRLTVTATDQDGNGLPIGLSFRVIVSAGSGAQGTLNVALSHFDEEPKTGTTRSNETDIDVTFPVVITP